MKAIRMASCAIAAVVALSVTVRTQTPAPQPVAPPAQATLLFRPFSDFQLRDLRNPIDGPSLQVAQEDNYRASFWASANCSGTLVGEEVMFTADHCFNARREDVWIDVGFTRYNGKCRSAANITNDTNLADFAVCLMDKVPIDVFETANFSPDALKDGDELLLTGFGGSDHFHAGINLLGPSTVMNIAGSVVTTRHGVWLHDGDSGGGGFAPSSLTNRRLVTVNARVEESQERSVVTLLTAVKDAVLAWQQTQRQAGRQVNICGLDSGLMNCHP